MHHWRDDATRWVWIVFGLIQATLTMLSAFDVLDHLELPQAVTAITLVVYVAVNELLAKPARERAAAKPAEPADEAWMVTD